METVIYVALFSVVFIVLSSLVFDLFSVRNQTRAARLTYQEARFILERINHRIRIAPGIDSGNSVFGQNPGKLILKSPVVATNLTAIELTDGNVTERVGQGVAAPISSEDVVVETLMFELLTSSQQQTSIQTTITIAFRDHGQADLRSRTSLTSQASLRNDYPYRFTQTDWSSGPGQELWSNASQYFSNPDSQVDDAGCSGNLRLGTDPDEIVIHVGDVCEFHGNFHLASDDSGADRVRAEDMPNQGLRVGGHFGNAAESSPTHYFDTNFKARSNTLYHVWARLKVAAASDFGTSDSLYLQFSDALEDGDPVNRIGGSQGLVVSQGDNTWAWDDIWQGTQTTGEIMSFEWSGDHTVRIQRREDGFAVDQIVLSSSTYFNQPPGNGTIVPKKYAPSAEVLSSKFDTGDASVFGQLLWVAFTPPSTSIKFQLRSASNSEALNSAPWLGPTDADDFYEISNVGVNSTHDGDRWVQVRAHLQTSDLRATPILNEFSLSYSN